MLLQSPVLGKAAWVWLLFAGVVVRSSRSTWACCTATTARSACSESLLLSAGYISIALSVRRLGLRGTSARRAGAEYFTGFLIEKSLSMDNVFVIALIFSYFAIPAAVPAPGAVLGHPGRDRAARADDRPRRRAGRASSAGCFTCSARSWCSPASRCGSSPTTCPTSATTRLLKFLRRHLRVTPQLEGNAFFVHAKRPD